MIGAGISGLVCAAALREAGVDAKVVEKASRSGGMIRSERRQGYLLELGPQSFRTTPCLRELCEKMCIGGDVIEAPRKAPRYVLVHGKLRPVPLSPPALVSTSLVSWATKRSIARDLFGKTRPPGPDESVANFVRRKFTAELLDRLVGPFISGIFAGDPEKLSLRAAFPQLHEAEKATGSVIRGSFHKAKPTAGRREQTELVSFAEGNEKLVEALAEKISPALYLNVEVVQLRAPNDGKKELELTLKSASGEETVRASRVVMATPAGVAGKLLNATNAELGGLLGSVEYAPVVVVALGYRKQDVGQELNGFGFLVPRSEQVRVLGTVWNTSLFANRAPAGHVLVTSFVGGATDPEAARLGDEELVNLVHEELQPLLDLRQKPIFANVEVYEQALPQYNLGHNDRVARIEALAGSLQNLWLTGNYLHGPAVGACVEQAQSVAEAVIKNLRDASNPHPI